MKNQLSNLDISAYTSWLFSQPSESCERPLYPCPLCCKIFTQASVFSNHKCFSVEQSEMRKQKQRNNVAATSTSVYHKVSHLHNTVIVWGQVGLAWGLGLNPFKLHQLQICTAFLLRWHEASCDARQGFFGHFLYKISRTIFLKA